MYVCVYVCVYVHTYIKQIAICTLHNNNTLFQPTAPSVTNITATLPRSHSITVTCIIHPDSTADRCVVTAIDDYGGNGTGNVNN